MAGFVEGWNMKADTRLRLLVVDDHDIVRRGLATLFDHQGDLTVVGEAGTAAQAVELARELCPQVVIMDIRLPDGSGIEACREILATNPEIRVLMLTSYGDDEAVMGSIMAGASGYLLKEVRAPEILEAIRRVGSGQSLLDPAVTTCVLERLRRGRWVDERWAQLTAQEQRILKLITEGCTNREIAQEVNLSDKTVKNYVSNILGKLEVSRRSQAAAYMAEHRARGEAPL